MKILLRALISKIAQLLLFCGSPIAAMDTFSLEELLKFEGTQNNLNNPQFSLLPIPEPITEKPLPLSLFKLKIEDSISQENVKFVPKKKATPPASCKFLAKKVTLEEQAFLNERIVVATDPVHVLNLINRGANVNACNKNFHNETPLHNAAHEQKSETVKLLLERGSDVNATNEYGKTALHYGCKNNNFEIAELLIAYGANVNLLCTNGKTALHYSCKNKNLKLAGLLIEHGANVNLKDINGNTALHYSCKNNNFELAQLLIHNGANVNLKDKNGKTALKLLSYKDSNFNYGSSPEINKTAEQQKCETVKLLIKHGATANTNDDENQTSLILYCKNNNFEQVELFIKRGVNMNVMDNKNQTALHCCCNNNNFELAQLLVNNGANANLKDIDGKTALHYSCNNNNLKLAELLVEHGADVNLKDMDGFTVLLRSLEKSDFEMIKLIMNHGARIDITDTAGKIAFDMLKNQSLKTLDDLCKNLVPAKKQKKPTFSQEKTSLFIASCTSAFAEQLQQGILPLTIQLPDTVIKEILRAVPDAVPLIRLLELAMNYCFLTADQQSRVNNRTYWWLSEKQNRLARDLLDCNASHVLKKLTDSKKLRAFFNGLLKFTQKKAQLKTKKHCFSDLKIYFKDPRYI
ncbi:MAG: hypothetical protein UV38_C0002G0175 [candidate division TM6 bacterium GW2011_GWE2_42_60]|nr:MAG: hypothetical protein UV38_C0002G0175 [candidate division TM6 bacterium GW2011_GWE2_42_60]HBY06068.1 hypothetical protein [Candidatus Dependentiae bacterium]